MNNPVYILEIVGCIKKQVAPTLSELNQKTKAFLASSRHGSTYNGSEYRIYKGEGTQSCFVAFSNPIKTGRIGA